MQVLGAPNRLLTTPVKDRSSSSEDLRLFNASERLHKLPGAGVFLLLCLLFFSNLAASEILTASWYSIQSLKDEGTWKHSKGVMANGKLFNDNLMVCACRIYPLGSLLRITNIHNGKSILVRVADRIGIRFARRRIDLSKRAFSRIADCKQGIIPCKVERIR